MVLAAFNDNFSVFTAFRTGAKKYIAAAAAALLWGVNLMVDSKESPHFLPGSAGILAGVPSYSGLWLFTNDSSESRYLRKEVLPGAVSSMVLSGLWSTKALVTDT